MQSSSLDVCPGSALHLLLGFHVITRGWFFCLRAQTWVSLSPNPQRIQNLISEAQVLRRYSKYFNIKAERKENLSRGVKMWEQNCFDLNKTKFTERFGIFLSTLTLYYQPRCPSLITTAFQLHLTRIWNTNPKPSPLKHRYPILFRFYNLPLHVLGFCAHEHFISVL